MLEVACRSAALSAVPGYSVASAETTKCEVKAHSKTATFSSDLTADPVSHGLIQPAAVCNRKVAPGTKSVNLSGIRNTHIPAKGRREGASMGVWEQSRRHHAPIAGRLLRAWCRAGSMTTASGCRPLPDSRSRLSRDQITFLADPAASFRRIWRIYECWSRARAQSA